MSGSFNSFRYLSLMFRADTGSFSGFDFTQAGNEPLKKFCISKINFSDISLAKITIHKF